MPRTKLQFEEIRKEKINLIKQVALELFANTGYSQTSINDIAQKANISKGLLYNYFNSKEELLRDIVTSMFIETYQAFDRNKNHELTGAEFEFFIREVFRHQKENRTYYKLYYVLVLQPQIQNYISQAMNEMIQNVTEVTLNYFKKHFQDPDTEMIIYSSMIKGLSMEYVFSPELFTDQKLEKAINRIIQLYKR